MRVYIIKLQERAVVGENRAQPKRIGRQNRRKTIRKSTQKRQIGSPQNGKKKQSKNHKKTDTTPKWDKFKTTN